MARCRHCYRFHQIDVTISDSGRSPHFNITVNVEVFVETVNDIATKTSLMVSGNCEAEPVGDVLARIVDAHGQHDGKRKKRDSELSVEEKKRAVEPQFITGALPSSLFRLIFYSGAVCGFSMEAFGNGRKIADSGSYIYRRLLS